MPMTAVYAARTPIPTDATTVTQRMRGMKSEIKINHPVKKLNIQIAAAGGASRSRKRGFFNLPALTLAAIDD
jgi:hypothetical protein